MIFHVMGIVYFPHKKSQAFNTLEVYINEVERQLDKRWKLSGQIKVVSIMDDMMKVNNNLVQLKSSLRNVVFVHKNCIIEIFNILWYNHFQEVQKEIREEHKNCIIEIFNILWYNHFQEVQKEIREERVIRHVWGTSQSRREKNVE